MKMIIDVYVKYSVYLWWEKNDDHIASPKSGKKTTVMMLNFRQRCICTGLNENDYWSVPTSNIQYICEEKIDDHITDPKSDEMRTVPYLLMLNLDKYAFVRDSMKMIIDVYVKYTFLFSVSGASSVASSWTRKDAEKPERLLAQGTVIFLTCRKFLFRTRNFMNTLQFYQFIFFVVDLKRLNS